MISVALTGNVASGKTLVAKIWMEAGVPVVLADDLAREVVRPGSPGLREVVSAFGEEVLARDGSLDRGALRDRIFRDPAERGRLEALLHPRIQGLREAWLRRQEENGAPVVVAEIPLLFEVGLEGDLDLVVLVDAPAEERLRRLIEDRDLPRETALAIMDAQMPSEKKRSRADFILDNDGTREELKERAMALLDLLRARARKREEP